MQPTWLEEMFGQKKPVIAMCHFNALPGDPGYDRQTGIEDVIEWALKDLQALQDGGVDGIMFSNEFSLPYVTDVDPITVASMARIIGEIRPNIKVPFGVNVLWDPMASLTLAVSTGAMFVREVFTGVYASDFGLWNRDCGRIIRHAHAIGAENVRTLFNIVPEGAAYLADRHVADIARSTEFNARPDAICVSGLTAGAETSTQTLSTVKQAVKSTPVIVNTGVNTKNVVEQLSIADAAVVGTAFKYEGVFENHVDSERVRAFMTEARKASSG